MTTRWKHSSSMASPTSSLISLLASLSMLSGGAWAACECGYSISLDSHDGETHVFTDLLESDFVHIDITDTDTYGEFGWAAQVHEKTKEAARGTYGQKASADNVVANIIEDNSVYAGPGIEGGDGGLQLIVDSEIEDDMVVGAEIATVDLELSYGTFRAGIKVTDIPGTCSAFYWYFNDTQEIDIEFLSSQFRTENSSYPINLVLQSQESSEHGHDASDTETFETMYLPFDPRTDFHEYRFDFLQDKVIFYADGEVLTEMGGSAVPSSAGHVLLSHWSNGNPSWSGGPPSTDATTTVSYVKAYFNSSSDARQNDYANRCADTSAEGAVCAIPNNDQTYFFSYQDNMTPNQTTYDEDGPSRAGETRPVWPLVVVAVLTSTVLAVGL